MTGFVGIWLALPASATEPCYGWTLPHVVEGEHVSVEYDDLVDEAGAQVVVDAADGAWEAYAAAGFRAPIGAPAIALEVDPIGRGGFATTQACGEENHSKLYVYDGAIRFDGGRTTTAHELFHAVQYGYDPSVDYLELYRSWPWWAEGTATWAEEIARNRNSQNFDSFEDYLTLGHLALHQDVTAIVDPSRSPFLYGTSVLAYTLDEHGGPDAIAATLEQGARNPGQPAWFPDVLAAIGVDFDELWADHLARLPSVDHRWGRDFDQQPPVVSVIRELPGTAAADPERPPQSLGWAIHRIRPDVADGTPLEVTFEGGAEARWHVVLVTARRNRPGSPSELLRAEITDGAAPLVLDVDHVDPLWIVVSPEGTLESADDDFAYTVDAAEVVEPEEGCGCATGPGSGGAWWLALGLVVLRRRR